MTIPYRQSGADVTCDLDVDRYNFQLLPAGSHVAWIAADLDWPFEAWDETGTDVSQQLFRREGRSVQTARPLIPIMMTTNPVIAVADCLFYAVERRR